MNRISKRISAALLAVSMAFTTPADMSNVHAMNNEIYKDGYGQANASNVPEEYFTASKQLYDIVTKNLTPDDPKFFEIDSIAKNILNL